MEFNQFTLDQLPCRSFQVSHGPVGSLGLTVINFAVGFQEVTKDFVIADKMNSTQQYILGVVEFGLPIAVRVKEALVDNPGYPVSG